MESSNIVKRKKRKTRKCLDEIRKRSRRTGQNLFEKDSSKVGNHNFNTVNNCLVTHNRLTLRMFPKAVRSETITRPALIDLKEKSNLNLDELVKGVGKAINTSNSTNVRMPEFDANSSEHLKNENFKFSNKCTLDESTSYNEPDIENMNSQEEKLSSNFDLFTSMDSAEVTDKSPESTRAQSVSTDMTSSNQSDDFGYKMYEEFMSEIPTYLNQNATLIQEDVMKKTKMFLHNLFLESSYQESGENMIKCEKTNTENDYTHNEMIVHNPMDYIRLGDVQQQSLFPRPSRIGGVIDGGCSIPHSPLLAPSLPGASPDSPLSVIVNDTPDYTYYPHRLN